MKDKAKKAAAATEEKAVSKKATKTAAKATAKPAKKAAAKDGFDPRAGMIKDMYEALRAKPKKAVPFTVLKKMGKADVKNRLYQLRAYGKKFGFRIKIKEDAAVFFPGSKEAA